MSSSLSRRGPWAFTDQQYIFDMNGIADIAEYAPFLNVLNALLGCNHFVDSLLGKNVNNRTAQNIRTAIQQINNGTHLVPMQRLLSDYKQDYIMVKTALQEGKIKIYKENMYNAYSFVILVLQKLWERTALNNVFTLNKVLYDYCVTCGHMGTEHPLPIYVYSITEKQLKNPAFDLEDSLYAERKRSNYICTTCDTPCSYRVSILKNAADTIVVQVPQSLNWQVPHSLILPYRESYTSYYGLASFIGYSDNGDIVTGVNTGDEKRYFKNGVAVPNATIHLYLVLFYTRLFTLDKFERTIN